MSNVIDREGFREEALTVLRAYKGNSLNIEEAAYELTCLAERHVFKPISECAKQAPTDSERCEHGVKRHNNPYFPCDFCSGARTHEESTK